MDLLTFVRRYSYDDEIPEQPQARQQHVFRAVKYVHAAVMGCFDLDQCLDALNILFNFTAKGLKQRHFLLHCGAVRVLVELVTVVRIFNSPDLLYDIYRILAALLCHDDFRTNAEIDYINIVVKSGLVETSISVLLSCYDDEAIVSLISRIINYIWNSDDTQAICSGSITDELLQVLLKSLKAHIAHADAFYITTQAVLQLIAPNISFPSASSSKCISYNSILMKGIALLSTDIWNTELSRIGMLLIITCTEYEKHSFNTLSREMLKHLCTCISAIFQRYLYEESVLRMALKLISSISKLTLELNFNIIAVQCGLCDVIIQSMKSKHYKRNRTYVISALKTVTQIINVKEKEFDPQGFEKVMQLNSEDTSFDDYFSTVSYTSLQVYLRLFLAHIQPLLNWERRKAFCLFLTEYGMFFCVHDLSTLYYTVLPEMEDNVPWLKIPRMSTCHRYVRKVFFSINLCRKIASFL